MPYHWTLSADAKASTLRVWPHRSLSRQGFVAFIAGTSVMLTLPLMLVLGTALLWFILPFAAAAVAGVWWGLDRSVRAGRLTETLTLAADRVSLVRHAPDGSERRWDADTYWVRVRLYPTGGPVAQYLTLQGAGREVEFGAFLTVAERKALAAQLRAALAGLKAP